MAQYLSVSVAARRFNLLLLSVFAGVALLLAGSGLYGVISYSVRQRTCELGLRLALGAKKWTLLRLVMGQGLKLALLGVAMGSAVALVLVRFLTGLLFEVRPADPTTFMGSVLLLIVVSLLACWLPAYRATSVDPLVSLRYEN